MKNWDDYLNSQWQKDGRVYRTVGVIDQPAVVIEDVDCPMERRTLVIGSELYKKYDRVDPGMIALVDQLFEEGKL